jgi:hypothetical protein
MTSVAVIGAGPAGLAAAHAAVGLGCKVRIFAPKKKTLQVGPLLLQRPIPGINSGHPDGYIKQVVVGGSILDYRRHLYGDINININGDILADGYHAWKMPATYDKLWDLYSGLISNQEISTPALAELVRNRDLIVNTAPAYIFCNSMFHNFSSKTVYVSEGTSYANQPGDTIVFNASPERAWARSSAIFGNYMTEWPHNYAGDGRRPIRKPIGTNCNCWPDVLRTGRFGSWRNETWVDTAYYDTRSALVSMERSEHWEIFDGS